MGFISDFWEWITDPDSWSGLDPENGSSYFDSYRDAYEASKGHRLENGVNAFKQIFGLDEPLQTVGKITDTALAGAPGFPAQAFRFFSNILTRNTAAKHIPLFNGFGSSSASGSTLTDIDDSNNDIQLSDFTSLFDNFYQEQDENRKFNAEQAALAREWQEKMASTNYQRAVSDLKAAGLNPVLAASGGISSSVPSAPSASNMSSGGDTMSSLVGALATSVNSVASILEAILPGRISIK